MARKQEKPKATRESGSWHERVTFDGDGTAYRPGEVIVPVRHAEQALELLEGLKASETPLGPASEAAFSRISFEGQVGDAIAALTRARIPSEPNQVVFVHSHAPGLQANPVYANPVYANPVYANPYSGCGCAPPPCHPANANPVYANPVYANPVYANPVYANPYSGCGCAPPPCHPANANPVYANPVYANPVYANPVYANPVYANPYSGCGCAPPPCHPANANPVYANPVYANPVYANPVYANPVYANYLATGHRSSSVRPADNPERAITALAPTASWASDKTAEVIVLDTGIAADAVFPDLLSDQPHLLGITAPHEELPDEDGDARLDPAAGHGTFIAGIIEQIAPGRRLTALSTITTQGDGDVAVIAATLLSLLDQIGDRTILNLSFGTYGDVNLGALRHAIEAVQAKGAVVVASTGNDGICVPQYPAAFPDVISVASIDDHGPAPYANYGPWVRACAPGTDVISCFFNWDGPQADGDDFSSQWARWTGTSFAAPIVAGVLARWLALHPDATAAEAVATIIDAPNLHRLPYHGTVINLSLS